MRFLPLVTPSLSAYAFVRRDGDDSPLFPPASADTIVPYVSDLTRFEEMVEIEMIQSDRITRGIPFRHCNETGQ
ncbi:unnamed protein product, partial [Iphiclides podalirius]